jgi:hypothetical protein
MSTGLTILAQKYLSTVIQNRNLIILNSGLVINSSNTHLCADFECSNLCFERLNLILKIRVSFISFILLFRIVELVDSKASERKFQFMCICSNYQRLVMFLNNRDNSSQQNFLFL